MKRTVIVLLVATFLGACTHPRTRIVAMHADGGDTAVAIWTRQNADKSWVGRVDTTGASIWSREFASETLVVEAVDGGFLVAGDHVIVRSRNDRAVVVTSLALSDGHQIWTHTATVLDADEGELDSNFDLWEADGSVLVATKRQFIVLGAVDGQPRAKLSMVHGERGPQVATKHVVLADATTVMSVELATGTSSQLESNVSGCVDGDEYVQIDDGKLLARPLGELQNAHVVADLPSKEAVALRDCGRYEGHRVLQTVVMGHDMTRRTQILTLDAKDHVAHVVDLGSDMHWVTRDGGRRRDVVGIVGTLPRFVPYVVVPFGEGENDHLVVIDLARGTIASERSPDRSIIDVAIFRHGTDWLVVRFGGVVEVLDGLTGGPSAKERVAATTVEVLAPEDIGNGQIWSSDRQWTSGHFQITRRDAHTLLSVTK